jgi:hypothetical protein
LQIRCPVGTHASDPIEPGPDDLEYDFVAMSPEGFVETVHRAHEERGGARIQSFSI